MIEYNKIYTGKCSWFGGPDDGDVSPSEGLAIYEKYEQNPSLFLKDQPVGTTGLARRLNPKVYFCACRWDYSITSKKELRNSLVQITYKNRTIVAAIADWGPHERTNRIIDVSKGAMTALGCQTDDEVSFMLFKSVVV